MKLKDGFVLREVAGKCVAVPTGAAVNFNGMISLNETARVLWNRLAEADASMDDLTSALTTEYAVDAETAARHAAAFVEKLRKLDFLE